jgi:hypothetical protein
VYGTQQIVANLICAGSGFSRAAIPSPFAGVDGAQHRERRTNLYGVNAQSHFLTKEKGR